MPATPVPPVTMPPVPPVGFPPVTAPPGLHPPPPVPPVPVPTLPVTSEHKTAHDACIKRLEQLEIPPDPKIYPSPTEPGTFGSVTEVLTNVFGVEVHKTSNFYQYSVHITAELSSKKEVTFTKKGKEDFIVHDRHEKCSAILFHALNRFEDFFKSSENCIIYDGQSILFTSMNLFEGIPTGKIKTKVFQINGADTNLKDLMVLPCIKLEVFPTKNPVVNFSLEDIGRRTSDSNIESVNMAYKQILDLAMSQYAIRETSKCVVFEHGKMFFINPLQEGYAPCDIVEVGDGKQMKPGLKKTLQFIEGPYGRNQNNPSIVIDGMKVAFHMEQLVFQKLSSITSNLANGITGSERERCAAVIKGLDCHSNYRGRTRHHKIESIHHEGAATARFELEGGGTCTVATYFKDKYKIQLRYPNANLIVCKERGALNFYPMELITISPNQRVRITQQTSSQSQRTTKESAVLPDIRQRLIMTGKIAAKITAENEVLGKMGVTVCDEPLVVKGRNLPAIRLASFETGEHLINPRDCKWRPQRYNRSAVAPKVWALYGVGSPGSQMNRDVMRRFCDEFMNMSRSKGILFPPPGDVNLLTPDAIENRLREAANAGCTFVLCITEDNITCLHQKYKFIEHHTQMIVQDMKLSKALSVVNASKKLTLENVINKTNVKLGGSNYVYLDTKNFLQEHLIIGVGISSPPPGTKYIMESRGILNPTIVGFAYNGNGKQEFSGDFVLNAAGQETIAPIEDIVSYSIKGYKKFHDGKAPKRITIYRSGSSEGNHGPIISYEVPLARVAMRNFSPDTQLLYIVVSKEHTYRFFKKESGGSSSGGSNSAGASNSGTLTSAPPKPWELNIGPGLTVDYGVTNPACKQFFLNSHMTLQGSAKTPLYTVLADDRNIGMSALEEFTFNLCHLHQIVGLPTSIPTPLYVANEYAKRGRNLWNEAINANEIPEVTGPESARLKKMTDGISYMGSGDMIDRRVNA